MGVVKSRSMKSLFSQRNILLAAFLLAVAALVILAAGLHGANFQKPRQFSQEESESIGFSVSSLVEQIADVPRWKQILFWASVYLMVLLVTSVLSPELRKKLLWGIVRLAVLSLVLLYVIKNRERLGLANLLPVTESGTSSALPDLNISTPIFSPPTIPPALAYLLSVLVLILTFGLFYLFGRGLAPRRLPVKKLPLDEIAAAARDSLHDLSAGKDWEDAILHCYARMSEVSARKRGLQRDQAMTPAEFASRLEWAGLPSHAVHTLTRLFESVRYGAHPTGANEREQAAACLRDILQYCGETA
jgi:hypothetical protein